MFVVEVEEKDWSVVRNIAWISASENNNKFCVEQRNQSASVKDSRFRQISQNLPVSFQKIKILWFEVQMLVHIN